ncbi:hypothetical protein EDD30_1092 [Couchioplanes caeruleus]|uniref:Secreted protein n=3 Tax=Couchioplanes caeruleus TaxID=56438 RepID=A0A1K0FXF6_9ACTN|nr:hypothetical protein BG844_35835 [Couchioplanes caeruleus subsp. caeruleus]ROP28344.1 hypothetical protein EDD30_1092 [Couchioplanes caeruleus]
MLRKLAAILVATTALLAGSAGVSSAAPTQPEFRAQGHMSGLTTAQAASLQQRVDAVLAAIPGGHQVSATEVRYDGLVVTFDPRSDSNTRTGAQLNVNCSYGWFCIVVRGTTFSFYECRWWDLTDWTGVSPYNNNQTPGTVFRAYDQNYNQVWTSTAPQTGSVNVTPWWHIKPC